LHILPDFTAKKGENEHTFVAKANATKIVYFELNIIEVHKKYY